METNVWNKERSFMVSDTRRHMFGINKELLWLVIHGDKRLEYEICVIIERHTQWQTFIVNKEYGSNVILIQ